MRTAIEHLEAAADAIEILAEFEREVQRVTHGRPSRWPHLGYIPHALGSRLNGTSEVDIVARKCAAHIGRV